MGLLNRRSDEQTRTTQETTEQNNVDFVWKVRDLTLKPYAQTGTNQKHN